MVEVKDLNGSKFIGSKFFVKETKKSGIHCSQCFPRGNKMRLLHFSIFFPPFSNCEN